MALTWTSQFYSGGAWVNPDRQVGGDYLEKSGGSIVGNLSIDGQLEILHTDDTNHAYGFTIYGTTKDGVTGKLLQAYHNSGDLPDAVNYTGVIGSNTNIVNKQYVDDRIAELEARIAALGG